MPVWESSRVLAPCRVILTVVSAAVLPLAMSVRPLSAQVPSRPALTQAQPPASANTGAISGVVIDARSGRPLAGAAVLVEGRTNTVRVRTDSRGRFVVSGLAASNGYRVRSEKPGYQTQGPESDLVVGQFHTVAVAEGEWIADLKLMMAPLASITGRVMDEHGDPAVGIIVRALARIPIAGDDQLAAGPTTRTDDRGIFRIGDLTGGRYLIMVPSVQAAVPSSTTIETLAGMSAANLNATLAAGRAATPPNASGLEIGDARLVIGNYLTPSALDPAREVYPVTFHPGARTAGSAMTIELADGEHRQGVDVTITPAAGFRVTGRLTGSLESLGGIVVRLVPEGNEALANGGEQATALTDGDGRFTFVGVPNGAYRLEARSVMSELVRGSSIASSVPPTPGWLSDGNTGTTVAAAPVGTMMATRRAAGNRVFAGRQSLVVNSTDVADVLLRIDAGVAVRGRFVYEGVAAPVPIVVSAEPANGRADLHVPSVRLTVPTLPETFVIEGLLPTAYFLRFSAPTGLMTKSVVAAGRSYTDEPFDAAANGDLADVVVTFTDQSASIAGTVHDAKGQAAKDVAVIAFPADAALWRRYGFNPPRIQVEAVGDDGAYTVMRLPAGDYYVVAVDLRAKDSWRDARFFPAAARVATRLSVGWGATAAQNLVIAQVVLQ